MQDNLFELHHLKNRECRGRVIFKTKKILFFILKIIINFTLHYSCDHSANSNNKNRSSQIPKIQLAQKTMRTNLIVHSKVTVQFSLID